MGVLIILPIIVAILSGVNDVFRDSASSCPRPPATDMVAIRTPQDHLTQIQGGLVVLAWAAVALAGALVTVKHRDA